MVSTGRPKSRVKRVSMIALIRPIVAVAIFRALVLLSMYGLIRATSINLADSTIRMAIVCEVALS